MLTQRLSLPESAYPEAQDVIRFYRALLDETRALPGVKSAGLLRSLPLGESIGDWGIDVEGYDEQALGSAQADWQVASEGAAETLGERLVSGRLLSRADDEKAPDVALINEAMARRYWAGQDPVGRRLRIGSPQRPWVTVVGVVGDVRHNGITGVVKAKFYRSYAQFHRSRGGRHARPGAGREDGRRPARARRADPGRRATPRPGGPGVAGADARRDRRWLDHRAPARLARAVALRRPGRPAVRGRRLRGPRDGRRGAPPGDRRAHGARGAASNVSRLVLGEGLAAVGSGLALGLVAAAFLSRSLGSLLHDVRPLDP